MPWGQHPAGGKGRHCKDAYDPVVPQWELLKLYSDQQNFQADLKIQIPGVPIMAQWKRIQLGTMRLLVRSLALLSGLRIWHCGELWCRSQIRLQSCIAVAVV